MDWKIGKVKFYQHQKQNASSNKSETKNSKTSWSLKKKKTNKQEQQIFEWHKKNLLNNNVHENTPRWHNLF